MSRYLILSWQTGAKQICIVLHCIDIKLDVHIYLRLAARLRLFSYKRVMHVARMILVMIQYNHVRVQDQVQGPESRKDERTSRIVESA
jgi:predicted phosphohydrolase